MSITITKKDGSTVEATKCQSNEDGSLTYTDADGSKATLSKDEWASMEVNG